MPRLESDLSDAQVFQLIPPSVQNGRVYEVDDTDGQGNIKRSKPNAYNPNGAPMVVLGWEILDGEYTGRKIRFDNIMLGGSTKEGKPMPLGQLAQFLHYTGTPWECLSCGTLHTGRHSFLIAQKADQERNSALKPTHYYCPKCENPSLKMTYDTANFMGATCGLSIGSQKKEGSDQEYNTIRGYRDLKE